MNVCSHLNISTFLPTSRGCTRRKSPLRISKRLCSIVAPALFNAGFDPLLVLSAIFLEELRRHWVGGGVGVGVTQERLDRGQDGWHVVRGTPPERQAKVKCRILFRELMARTIEPWNVQKCPTTWVPHEGQLSSVNKTWGRCLDPRNDPKMRGTNFMALWYVPLSARESSYFR